MDQIKLEMEDAQLSELSENENDTEGDKILHANLRQIKTEEKKEE
jgi:hypothetical protein